MNRRKFLISSLATIPAFVIKPGLTPSQDAQLSPVLGDKIDPTTASKITEYETHIAAHPGQFDWAVHNELRHLYLSVDEHRAMLHADTILAHSLMDSYVLNTLSDWYIEKDPRMAVVALLGRAERHQSLRHLVAASLIKAGTLVNTHVGSSKGDQFFHSVLTIGHQIASPAPSWKQYERLAQLYLQS